MERGFASETPGTRRNGISSPAREAGASIKPRVERGFASGTLGQRGLEKFQPAERATVREPTASIARFAGSQFLNTIGPRVPEQARSTLGFTLTPAPQATTFSCKADSSLSPILLVIARKFSLRKLPDESRMPVLTITAASSFKFAGDTHHSSGWEIEQHIGRCLIVKDECIVMHSALF